MPDAVGGLSPIDVTSTVEMFMTKEQLPLMRLKRSEAQQEVQLSANGQLQNLMMNFQTSLTQLNSVFNAVAYQVSSTNTNVITAQITGNNIAPISHAISVTQLATAESQSSMFFSQNDGALNITDTLGFTIGSSNFSIDVGSTDSLENVRDNINNAFENIGVTASILSSNTLDGTPQYQLIVSSNQTGVANGVSISDSASSFNFTESVTAADAQFTFDNQYIDRSTNNVSDALDGITLNLTGLGSSTLNITGTDPAALTQSATTAIQNMLNAYNAALAYIDENQANPQTHNELFPLMKLNLQNAMNAQFTGVGPFSSLSDIGIVVQDDSLNKKTTMTTIKDKNGQEVKKEITYTLSGQLVLNTDPLLPSLNQVLTDNYDAVQSFLTNDQTGILTGAGALVDPLMGNVTNSLKTNSTVLTEREKKYVQEIADEDLRLKDVKANYTKKFAALNVLLEKLQKTNDYLSRQLDQLNRNMWDS